MKKRLFFASLAIAALSGCVNSDYDLENIDTNSRITINNLTVPIQLDAVTLDEMLDIDNSGQVKSTPNGYYEFSEKGTFVSKEIMVDKFTAKGIGTIAQAEDFDITYVDGTQPAKHKEKGTVLATATIPHQKTSIEFQTKDIDAAIVSVERLGLEAALKLNIRFDKLQSMLKHLHVENLEIQFVKGLTMTTSVGTYDPATGVISIPDAQTNDQHVFNLELNVTAINAEEAGAKIENGEFIFKAEPQVINGELKGYADDLKSGIPMDPPQKATFLIDMTSNDMVVNEFTGKIKYSITGFNIDPIMLNDVPGIISQSGTNIELSKINLLLDANNPLIQAGYTLEKAPQMGLAFKGNETYSIPSDAIKFSKESNAFNISNDPTPFEERENVNFTDMGKILSGSKLPEKVTVEVLDPCIPEQRIENFKLGQTLNKVEGSWEFIAPLNLTENSTIKYEKDWDDLQDDDLDGLTVKSAVVTADIDSQIALDLEVTVTLLGRNGEIKGVAEIPCGADKFTAEIGGNSSVSQIYGAKIELRAKGKDQTLAPDQTVTIKNLKATLNGYYEKEF